MTQATIRPFGGGTRANWIRLQTMIMLRWVAIVGQLIATTFAPVIFNLSLELELCYLLIGIAAAFNLVATYLFPESKRLTEFENLLMILFDLGQLGVLLYLTGGLHNPFAILLLGPVTISAAALTLRSTVLVCAVAIVIVTVLARVFLPLESTDGEVLQIPEIFITGVWFSLTIAILFTSAYSRRVTSEIHSMADALAATQMALAREQKLTDLGGVVAAAAHELGTPLATIKLTSSELIRELQDNDDLREDVELIRNQTDRCRDILRNMGRAGKDDEHMKRAPLLVMVERAAEPHMKRGKSVEIQILNDDHSEQPTVRQLPEIVHGLRNLVQNAVDFAQENVWIEMRWTATDIVLRITDDGPGFPLQLLGRIGDPFMRPRRRRQPNDERPEYEGMGLGLFIAKTLLERTGAVLHFSNADGDEKSTGALVELRWPREKIEIPSEKLKESLGDNRPFETYG